MEQQHTIGKEVSYSGIALHTGSDTTITFKPAPENTGIQFLRTDLTGSAPVKAQVAKVADVVRGTNIAQGEAKIYTVEHLLAAFLGLGVDNVLVEMNANEPPVGDGSALHFVEMIKEAGIVSQGVARKYCHLQQTMWVNENGSMIVVLPSDQLIVSCTISFDHNEVASQHITLKIDSDSFIRQVAPARTFCFQHEVENLMAQGLIKGGSLDNAVVIGNEAVLSKESLRFKDEFVRHKILDLLGDLSLIGCPLRAHIIAIKPGHNLNIKLARDLYQKVLSPKKEQKRNMKTETINNTIQFDTQQIMNVLPHRYPFLLVDKVVATSEKEIVGIKNVTINEPFFQGHFPGRPIMPGVLIVEAMAQLGGIMLLQKTEYLGKYAYFMSMDNVKFRKTVLPGDQLRMRAELVKARSRTGKVRVEAYVEDSLVCEGNLMFTLVDGQE